MDHRDDNSRAVNEAASVNEDVDKPPKPVDHVDRRLKAVGNVQLMSRVALSACLVLSVLIVVAQFNAYYSWYREFAKNPLDEKTLREEGKSEEKIYLIRELRKELTKQWIESRPFRLPFVDMLVLPSDIAILGGLSICIGVMFLHFYGRREHLMIGHLLHDAYRVEDKGFREAILHAILSGFAFVSFTSPEVKYERLEKIPDQHKVTPRLSRPLFCLIMCPALAIGFSVVADVISYFFFESPFRGDPPWKRFKVNGPWFIVRTLVATALFVWVWRHCRAVVQYHHATGSLVEQYINYCSPKTGSSRAPGQQAGESWPWFSRRRPQRKTTTDEG